MNHYKILADMHTHTIASGHAFSTVQENLVSAKYNDIKYVAVTDHFFYPKDRIDRLNELSRITHAYTVNSSTGVNVIAGVEGNLSQMLDYKDANKINNSVKWRLVGVHDWFLDNNTTPVMTIPDYFLYSLKHDVYIKPTAFAHIERCLKSYIGGDKYRNIHDALHEIVDIAVSNDVMLEINEHSLHMGPETVDLMKLWVYYAKEKNAKFCLGTDAHYCEDVGKFIETLEFIDFMGLDSHYILNFDEDAIKWLK